jgi:hypothetical protein
MKPILLLILLLASCVSTPKNPEAWMEREINACLPTAIAFREGLRKYNVWSEVLVTTWNDPKPRGHAFCVYLYPSGKNQLWSYDQWGSYRTRAFTNNPTQVAEQALRARAIYNPPTSAYYVK